MWSDKSRCRFREAVMTKERRDVRIWMGNNKVIDGE